MGARHAKKIKNYMNKFLTRFALLAATLSALALQSCEDVYFEDMTNCYAGVSVTLRIDPSMTDAEAAEAIASRAELYVFDAEGNFLERRETHIGKTELLLHKEAGELTVVGWINEDDAIYNTTPFDEGSMRGDGLLALASLTRTEGEYSLPTDLFYGEAQLVNEGMSLTEEHKEILAARRTGQANITVKSLRNYAGMQDDDFYITTRFTGGNIDFFGRTASYTASHTPAAAFSSAGEFLAGNFNLMPTNEGTPMVVELWHRTKGLIYSTTTHNSGGDITIDNNSTTNILIDFTTGINIRIEKTLWGTMHSWKTYN
jgi:hypothetical protein